MQKTCRQCQASYEISEEDQAMREKLAPVVGGKKRILPDPDICFTCRFRRRTAFYNCRSLYKRTCDFSGKQIVSIFSPDKPFKVFDKDIWYSDQWDPLFSGRDFDFSRPFFPQIRELIEATPMLGIIHFGWPNVNSDFTNDNYKVKNCYLTFDGEQAEDCYYGHSFVILKNCIDFLHLVQSELCYECVHCHSCYNCMYSRYSKNCSDSWFLRDCLGCKHCFGCANLRQKEYCIWNEQKTKEEYEAFMRTFDSSSYAAVQAIRGQAEEFFRVQPVKYMRGEQNVNVMGDTTNNSKNSYWCFDCNYQEDSRYATGCMMPAKDLLDVHVWGDSLELAYESCVVGADARNLYFDYNVSQSTRDVFYSLYCSLGSESLFGCVGLRRKKHCILNKQYSPAEYDELSGRIVDHMEKTGEWGQFFPTEIALFGYNETMAQTYLPLTKEEVQGRGWQWCDYEAEVEATRVIPADQLPDKIENIPDDILEWAVQCEVTGKPYKIIQKELDFYREHRLPVPRRHPDQRHRDRFAYKNPFMLFDRACGKCIKPIATSYAPEKPEIVYCEECYLAAVY